MRNQAGRIDRIRRTPRASRPADRPGVRPEEQTPATDGSLWEIAEVGAYLKLPVSSVYKMTAAKAVVRIPHIRIGGKLRFRRSDVDRWLTLLTVSNLEVLSRMQEKASRVIHGHHSQTQAP